MSQSISSSIKSIDKPLDKIIYKVKKLVNDKVDTIYVFYGRKEKEINEDKLIKQIFSDKEYDNIKANNTKIIFSEQIIHPDDSIATIKIKIFNELKKTVSLEEIYLFCEKSEKLNSVTVYQSLTQNKKIGLTKIRLDQFIQNIVSDLEGKQFPEPQEKEIYSYDDIFEMKFDNKEYIINKVLGQKFFIVENEYPFVCNPFDVKEYDDFFEKYARKSLSTLNNHLLLNTGNIIDNSIYLCLAQDVLRYVETKDISEQTTIKIYYPFLYNKNINSIEDLERNQDKLIEGNRVLYSEKIFDSFKTIDMFYDIYNLRKSELNYVNRGIKYIKVVMKPDFNVKIPLEIIFKIVHATESNPLIKYNPSSRQENIYRLYTDKIATDGRKIPYLKKASIFKLMKTIGRTKSVSVYIETIDEFILNCEFDEEGYITMSGEFNKLINVSQIDEIFKSTINPIIQEIKSVLEQSGYKFNLFNSLNDENIEIKQMTYETQISITKAFDIKNYRACINSVFVNETNALKGTPDKIKLRFKRVSNFSKFTSQEAFILEKAEQGLRGSDIIQSLLENFADDLTEEQARELVAKVANELEVERGVRKSDIKIKENPGFTTEIVLDFKTAILKITTENINNINYLLTLPIYLDTMVRITQDKNSTNFPSSEIKQICNTETGDVSIPDITSSTELSAKKGEEADIEGDESIKYIKYTEIEKEKPKGAFSLLFDEDDSSESYESEGGNNKSLKGGQISSEPGPYKPKKLKYGNVVPSGISSPQESSSEESISSEESTTSTKISSPSVINIPNTNIEKNVVQSSSQSELSSLAKESSSSKESDRPLDSLPSISSSKESVSSEKVTTPVTQTKILSPTKSEESVSSEKVTTPVTQTKILSPTKSEESVSSEKVTTPVTQTKILSPTKSEESVSSEKVTTPVTQTKILSPTKSEEYVSSEKVTTPVTQTKILSPTKSEESVSSDDEDIALSELSGIPSLAKDSVSNKKSSKKAKSVSSENSISSAKFSESSKSSSRSSKSKSSVKSLTDSELADLYITDRDAFNKYMEDYENKKVTTPATQTKILSPTKSEESVSSEKETTKIDKSKDEEHIPVLSSIKSMSSEKEEEEPEEEVQEEPEEEVQEEPEEEVQEEPEEKLRNIDGMKLNKPYYFQTLIEKRDPILIVKEDTKEYNGYSRTCLSDKRRQPVILTDNQLEKIHKEHPGFLREQDVIKYGSDKNHQFNYICPRYWCLKSNTFINPADIKIVNGEKVHKPKKGPSCGKVLPKKEKKVKPGYYIYEFNDEAYPGLIPDKHPKGLCLPCCFKNYNTEGRIKAKQSCLDKEKKQEDKKEVQKQQIPSKEDAYVLGPEKFPLDFGRWGYLPVEIQTILHEINADCQVSKINTNVKENHPCLLRHGVEVNKRQSFIAAISDLLFYGKRVIDEENKITTKEAKVFSIKEMRERIVKSIKIDTFIKYQNGNLVNDFYDPDKKVDIQKHQNSKLYSKIDLNKEEDKSYFTKVISAFENFTTFLRDDDAIIDHTYLWDIISMPNKYLFPDGVNLIIFQLPHDDITNNVQLLCPTNHYSSEFYEARKPSIFLIKEDGYYEPIYSYLNNGKKIIVTKEFKERDPQLSKTMRAVFKELIKPFFELICRPLDSMPKNIYKAKRPLLLYNLVQKLDKYEYTIEKLVMNFNNKIIGVIAKEPKPSKKTGFIPCYPSALNENLKKGLDFVFMNDETLWNTYNATIDFLDKLHRKSAKRKDEPDIPCKPEFNIVEDEMVVGILTNTNQFIQISEPIRADEIISKLDLPSITDEDYIVNSKDRPMIQADSQIMTQNVVDVEREDYIKKIKLETSFYNVFRNTIRILLNNYENIKIRVKIETEMAKEYIIYSDKLTNINRLLRQLVGDKIQFIGDKNYYKLINEVSTCIVKDADKCKSTPNLCVVTENGKCNIILPERNLITDKENEPIYFGRMADELIRYNRIKSFMLQPQTYLSFGNIGYNLRDNEIILIQSSLTQEYFENLIPVVANKYVRYNSYDETQPNITQLYDNKVPSLDQAIGRKNKLICDKIDNDHIKSSVWKKCFPDNFIETEYSKYNFCTFNFIIDIIERKTKERFTISDIKNQLYDEYKKYLEKYKEKIVDILIIEGKKTLGDQVHADTLTFASFIYTDNYFLTTLDLWLLVNRFKIPTIFICQKFILQTKYEKHLFVGYGDENDKFAFVVLPGFRPENVPNFKIIKTDKGDVFISLKEINEECIENIEEAIRNKIDIEDYLQNFILPPNYVKKKPLLIMSDSEEKEVKPKKSKIIIEETSKVSVDIPIINNVKKSRKIKIKGDPKNKSRRKQGVKKRKLLIVDSSSTEQV